MKGSGIILAALVILTSAVLVYHRANPAIAVKWVTYQSGGDSVRAFVALPEGAGPFPAVIVIHEWWGLNDWVKTKTRDLAGQGYVAMAIDLYRGEVTDDAEIAHELSRGLPTDRATRDLKAAFNYLRQREDVDPERIASIGWCMGGGYSLQAAVHLPGLAACVINYGRLVTEREKIRRINAPILGIFGGKDRGIPVKSVREFEKTCKELAKEIHIEIYPNSGHAFMNENNSQGYNEKDATAAWDKITTFLEGELKY